MKTEEQVKELIAQHQKELDLFRSINASQTSVRVLESAIGALQWVVKK